MNKTKFKMFENISENSSLFIIKMNDCKVKITLTKPFKVKNHNFFSDICNILKTSLEKP